MIKKDFFDIETQRRFWEIRKFLSGCSVVVRMSDQRLKLDLLLIKRKNTGGSKERIEIILIDG